MPQIGKKITQFDILSSTNLRPKPKLAFAAPIENDSLRLDQLEQEPQFRTSNKKDINVILVFRRNFNKLIPGRAIDPASKLLQEFQRRSAELESSV